MEPGWVTRSIHKDRAHEVACAVPYWWRRSPAGQCPVPALTSGGAGPAPREGDVWYGAEGRDFDGRSQWHGLQW